MTPDGSFSFVVVVFIVSLFLAGSVMTMLGFVVDQHVPSVSSTGNTGDVAVYNGAWSSEIMYTGTVQNYLGQTLFYEHDSTSYSYQVKVYPNKEINGYFTQLNGVGVDKTTGIGVTYNDVAPAQMVKMVWVTAGPGSDVYMQMAEYQHDFVVSTIFWTYDVSYNLYIYAGEYSPSMENNIQGSWSFEQSSSTIPATLTFPVEFGD